jgi:DNA polymerase-3 subunit epsilon
MKSAIITFAKADTDTSKPIHPMPFLLNSFNFENIPSYTTGVYYFYNRNHDVIYVGKSRDIRKRLLQHFLSAGNKRKTSMLEEIADVSYENTDNELIALLLESHEIKNIKPKYNISQKNTNRVSYVGVFQKYDSKGYLNLFVKRLRNDVEPIIAAETVSEANDLLNRISEKFNLCLAKCSLHETKEACFNYHMQHCFGACIAEEPSSEYNSRVKIAIRNFGFEKENFFIVGEGRTQSEKSLVCVEQGKYKGFGFIDFTFGPPGIEDMKDAIKSYDHNKNIQQILCGYMKHELVKIPFADSNSVFYQD